MNIIVLVFLFSSISPIYFIFLLLPLVNMTIVDELGYIFIAFGPALAMFFVTVARQPHEVIVMILG